ncbi:MAG: hypothetical protein ACR2GY_06000 [Phycisphaerales bacterium]
MPGSTDFLPHTDSGLLSWSQNFLDRISSVSGPYGLSPAQITSYTDAHNAYNNALTAATQDVTRTPVSIGVKNERRSELKELARELVAFIQGMPDTTNEDRLELQITVRDYEPTPVPVPDAAPIVIIENSSGTYVDIRLRDLAAPDSRAKPSGVTGATIFSAFGATAPDLADVEAWTFRGNVTRTLTTLDFAGAASGTTVWITAFWYNSKGESGPPTQPVSVQIPGQAAQQSSQNLQFPEGLQEAA